MNKKDSLFHGKLVNLKPIGLEKMAAAYIEWHRDTEYSRLADDNPANLYTARADQEWLEGHADSMAMFGIHTASDDRLIGSIELAGFNWCSGDAWVGLGIGDRECWGKGYGTEAMKIVLRYAFEELNLHRVSLSVFAYNTRAIRSYEKAGFQEEGRLRQFMRREGQAWDLVYMGILRSEWEAVQGR